MKKRCKLFHRWKYTFDDKEPVRRICEKCDFEQHYVLVNRPFFPTYWLDAAVIKKGDNPFTIYDFYEKKSYY